MPGPCGLAAMRGAADAQECEAYSTRASKSATCQYSPVAALRSCSVQAKTCTSLYQQEHHFKHTHFTQRSPGSGNWRHSSAGAHCEEAASQTRRHHALDPLSTSGPLSATFWYALTALWSGRARDAKRVETTETTKKGRQTSYCVSAYYCPRCIVAGHSEPLQRVANASSASAELLKCRCGALVWRTHDACQVFRFWKGPTGGIPLCRCLSYQIKSFKRCLCHPIPGVLCLWEASLDYQTNVM